MSFAKLTSHREIGKRFNIVDLANVFALVFRAKLVDVDLVVGALGLHVVLEAVEDLLLVLVPLEIRLSD